jgi:hypothetical protein
LTGEFTLRVVGTFYYQEALHDLYGPRCYEGVRIEDDGDLVTEDNNAFDPNAIALIVGDQMLGHLSRGHAVLFRDAATEISVLRARFPVRLLVTGGVSYGVGRLDQFSVHLDLCVPFRFE